jgi:hypothetical protein
MAKDGDNLFIQVPSIKLMEVQVAKDGNDTRWQYVSQKIDDFEQNENSSTNEITQITQITK